MSLLSDTVTRIEPLDADAATAVQHALDTKTKPRGSLGRLEQLAVHLAGIRGTADLASLDTAIVVAAADHGVAAEGVSAYSQEVTTQMLANFEAGGAAVCVLARAAHAALHVVDVGVGNGTRNIAIGPAMDRAGAVALIERGIATAAQLADDGADAIALGEMGIGNTTAAAAVSAALLAVPPRDVCGPGTGLDVEGVARKIAVVERALGVNRPPAGDPVAVLASVGGYELAFLCGVVLGCAAERVAAVLDGFIVGASALAAVELAPAARDFLIAAHRSPEPGHGVVLNALGLEPLLDLGLRLGEGSGAALALPLLRAAVAVQKEMATFDAAGVTDAGR